MKYPRPHTPEKRPMNRPRSIAASCRRPAAAAPFVLLLAVGWLLLGCGSGSSAVQVGPIVFTDANGNQLGGSHKSLSVGATTYVDAALTGNGAELGVDWSIYCGSEPPPGTPPPPGQIQDESCGLFTPVHTASAPVPQYASSGAGIVTVYTAPAAPPKTGVVILYAAATANHSRFSSVTLTIVSPPISIQFAPPPPSALPVSGTTQLKAVLTNDFASGGAAWTATCGSADCGSFSAAQTASGVATTYTAPASAPAGGSVTITATSVTDPTKSVSASISILPVMVTLSEQSQSVVVGGTDLLTAEVANDVSNAGVDWTLSCATSGGCGTITAHTASGIAATYTAPASVPSGGTVQVTAASTSNPAATGVTTITVSASQAVFVGHVRAGDVPVSGASIELYAAGETGYGSSSTLLNPAKAHASLTADDGSFSVASDGSCPAPDSELYLIAEGGDAGAGENRSLQFMAALGPCNASGSHHHVMIDEATTVAASWALAGFIRDAEHIGTAADNRIGLANAFTAASNLVDPESGQARAITPAGNAIVPEAEINSVANILNSCAGTAGGAAGDGSACGTLFAHTGGASTANTREAALWFARQSGNANAADELNLLVAAFGENGPYAPALQSAPADWRLALHFTGQDLTNPRSLSIDAAGNVWIEAYPGVTELNPAGAELPGSPFSTTPCGLASASEADPPVAAIDPSGNRWALGSDENPVTEFVGVAAPAGIARRAAGSCADQGITP